MPKSARTPRSPTVPIDFSLVQIAAIVESAGGFPVKTRKAIDARIVRLRETLVYLTWDLFLGRFLQNLPAPFSLRKKMESIESSSTRLIKTLEIQGNDPPTIPDELYTFLKQLAAQYRGTNIQGEEEVEAALASILLLREWARIGIDRTSRSVEKGKISGKSHHAPDRALQEFYEGLAGIWRTVFGQRPAISVDRIDGSTGGAFVTFVAAVFAALRDNLTADMEKADPSLRTYLSPRDDATRYRVQTIKSTLKKS